METQPHDNLHHAPVSSSDADNLHSDAVTEISNHRWFANSLARFFLFQKLLELILSLRLFFQRHWSKKRRFKGWSYSDSTSYCFHREVLVRFTFMLPLVNVIVMMFVYFFPSLNEEIGSSVVIRFGFVSVFGR